MKKVGIFTLILLLLLALGYFGYKYYKADNFLTENNPIETNNSQPENFIPAIKVGPKPSMLDEDGSIFSHPDNAIYDLDKN